MDFYKLLNKIDELNKPVLAESAYTPISECGESMGEQAGSPPSMTVNLSASGMDDISSLMQLLVKVNPDMMPKQDSGDVSFGNEPSIISISPDKSPLKMLPEPSDMDGDEDGDLDHDDDEGMIGGMAGAALGTIAGGPLGSAVGSAVGDELTGEEMDGGFQSASTSPDEEYQDTDFMVNKLAGGLNKSHNMNKHSYRQGDNPMAMPESKDLRTSIRDDLHRRLAEAKLK